MLSASFCLLSLKQASWLFYHINKSACFPYTDLDHLLYSYARMLMASIFDLEYQGRNLLNYMGIPSWKLALHVVLSKIHPYSCSCSSCNMYLFLLSIVGISSINIDQCGLYNSCLYNYRFHFEIVFQILVQCYCQTCEGICGILRLKLLG